MTVYPYAQSFYMSLTHFTRQGRFIFIGLENYKKMLSDGYFWTSLKTTFFLTAGDILVSFLIGFGLALLLNREFKGHHIIRALFLLPLIVSRVVSGLTWKFMLDPTLGIVNYFLGFIGLPKNIAWVSTPSLAILSIIIADTWKYSPWVFLLMLAGLQSLPKEPYEAAKVDGASRLQVFRWITLPLLKPLIVIALIFRTHGAFLMFDVIYALTKGGPGIATENLNFYAFDNCYTYLKLGYGSALIIILFLISLVICVAYLSQLRGRV